jgi:dihydrofolate reductase
MFGPIRGEWGDDEWRGWWGEDPPYHHPVFVLTHHPRPLLPMEGGTTFHFVEDDIATVRERALEAAGGADVRIGGGPGTIQQFLRAGLIDEMHVAVVPVLLGAGERLLDNLGESADAYECVELVSSPSVVHVRLARKPT